jgi:hypothetical protein
MTTVDLTNLAKALPDGFDLMDPHGNELVVDTSCSGAAIISVVRDNDHDLPRPRACFGPDDIIRIALGLLALGERLRAEQAAARANLLAPPPPRQLVRKFPTELTPADVELRNALGHADATGWLPVGRHLTVHAADRALDHGLATPARNPGGYLVGIQLNGACDAWLSGGTR